MPWSTKKLGEVLKMKTKPFQNRITEKLREYFLEVEKEWSVTRGATDILSTNKKRYAPRLDVAVGPFSVSVGNKENKIKNTFDHKAPRNLRRFIESSMLQENSNPRCMLAIEVVFSGSSKHILGDITNASMMGLYGFVVASSSTFKKVNRIFEYVKIIKQVGKAPSELFSNVCVVSDEEFLKLL